MPGNARGSLTVSDQGLLNVAGATSDQTIFVIGQGAGDGEVLVDTGGMIDIQGSLQVSTPFITGPFGVTLGSDTQTGLLTINDTGEVNALATVVGDRGTITGTGTLNTDLLTVDDGGVVSLSHLSGVAAVLVDSGLIDVPNDLILGRPLGQTINIDSVGELMVDGNLTVGSADAPAALSLVTSGESFATATTTTVGDQGQILGEGVLSTDLLTIETGGFVGLTELWRIAVVDVAGGTLTVPNDLILGRSLPQSMAVNAGGTATITGTLFVGGEAPATLGGNGGSLFANAVVVNSNGILGPGNSVGTLDIIGDLTLGGGELMFEIAGTLRANTTC